MTDSSGLYDEITDDQQDLPIAKQKPGSSFELEQDADKPGEAKISEKTEDDEPESEAGFEIDEDGVLTIDHQSPELDEETNDGPAADSKSSTAKKSASKDPSFDEDELIG